MTTPCACNTIGNITAGPLGAYTYGDAGQAHAATAVGGAAGSLGSLAFYGSRWYSPVLGRFLQPDTLVPGTGNPQNLNRYSYVGNNPLRRVDPTGHYALLDDNTYAFPWNGNVVVGPSNLVLGRDNTVLGVGNTVIGNGNFADSFGNVVVGDDNRVDGSVNRIAGNRNVVAGSFNTVAGDDNTVAGAFNIVVGNRNSIFGAENTVGGDDKVFAGAGGRDVTLARPPGAPPAPWRLGGRDADVSKGVSLFGGESHHLIAATVLKRAGQSSPFSEYSGPAIWMSVVDHDLTNSSGSGRAARAYQDDQLDLVQRGRWQAALLLDVYSIQRTFGSRYDLGILEMFEMLPR